MSRFKGLTDNGRKVHSILAGIGLESEIFDPTRCIAWRLMGRTKVVQAVQFTLYYLIFFFLRSSMESLTSPASPYGSHRVSSESYQYRPSHKSKAMNQVTRNRSRRFTTQWGLYVDAVRTLDADTNLAGP